jgi:hypothetical protein
MPGEPDGQDHEAEEEAGSGSRFHTEGLEEEHLKFAF